MFSAVLFITGPNCKQPTYSSSKDWVRELRRLQAEEYHSATKKNRILLQATTPKGLKHTASNEISQTLKSACCLTPLNEIQGQVKSIYGDKKTVKGIIARVGENFPG